MQHEPYDANASGSSPIRLAFNQQQVDYIRELVYEDLKEWADAVKDMVWYASERQGRCTEAADAEDMCRSRGAGSRPHMSVLDVLGWEHPEHLAGRLRLQAERKDAA